MGSYASSYTNSKTSNSNLPVTLSGDNPLALTAAGSDGSQVGGSGNVNGSYTSNTNLSGSSINTLDGGAISKAFDFGSNLVGIIADMTRNNNQAAQTQSSNQTLSGAAVAAGVVAPETTELTVDNLLKNKTLIYAVAAVAAAYFLLLRK